MSQRLTPSRVPTPGKILERELKARGWSQKDLAEIIGCSIQGINEIIRGTKQITPETAIEVLALKRFGCRDTINPFRKTFGLRISTLI